MRSRWPGASERIPNFANARGAAERLARHPAWKKAKTIKANPDAPQTHSRRLALEEEVILVAVQRAAVVIEVRERRGALVDRDDHELVAARGGVTDRRLVCGECRHGEGSHQAERGQRAEDGAGAAPRAS